MGRGKGWNKENLLGQRFGRLVVESPAPSKNGQTCWACRCDCGETSVAHASNLRAGRTKSCGCGQNFGCRRTHGLSKSPIANIRAHMIRRCSKPDDTHYAYYGGRGIRVCQRWRDSLPAFADDMGHRPRGFTIDRINNDGHYSCGKCEQCVANGWPANCHWATRVQQARNKSSNVVLTFMGETMTVIEWSERTGIKAKLIYERIERGWTAERALTKRVA